MKCFEKRTGKSMIKKTKKKDETYRMVFCKCQLEMFVCVCVYIFRSSWMICVAWHSVDMTFVDVIDLSKCFRVMPCHSCINSHSILLQTKCIHWQRNIIRCMMRFENGIFKTNMENATKTKWKPNEKKVTV